MFWLYRFLTTLAGPFLPLLLRYRERHGKEDSARIGERLGHTDYARPEGPLLWVHAASIGESTSVLPLLDTLARRYPDWHILLTTVTVSSAKLMAQKLPVGAFHQFAPLDHPKVIRRFLAHWQPKAAIWVESEIWPNMIHQTHESGCPMVMVNARMSGRSFRRWMRYRRLLTSLLACFDGFYAQSRADGERLKQLGAKRVEFLGNLKYDAPPLPADNAELDALRAMIGKRPLWLAASTHAGEEEVSARVHRALKVLYPDLLTVVVPRHAPRGKAVAETLTAAGLTVALRSEVQAITADTAVYVADTTGELGLFYRLAGIVFIGGSLVPHGGQNPLEAARLDCAIVYGPHMHNFTDITALLEQAGASRRVDSETALQEAIELMLRSPELQAQQAKAARDVVETQKGVVEALVARFEPLLGPVVTELTKEAV